MGSPTGIAIDHEAGRLYWVDELEGGGVFSAALAGGDARQLDTGGAAVTEPSFPFLFKAPKTTFDAVPASFVTELIEWYKLEQRLAVKAAYMVPWCLGALF